MDSNFSFFSEPGFDIWVHLLNDWEEALRHCNRIEQTRVSVAQDAGTAEKPPVETGIFTLLAEVCLRPLDPIALGIVPRKTGDGKSLYFWRFDYLVTAWHLPRFLALYRTAENSEVAYCGHRVYFCIATTVPTKVPIELVNRTS